MVVSLHTSKEKLRTAKTAFCRMWLSFNVSTNVLTYGLDGIGASHVNASSFFSVIRAST